MQLKIIVYLYPKLRSRDRRFVYSFKAFVIFFKSLLFNYLSLLIDYFLLKKINYFKLIISLVIYFLSFKSSIPFISLLSFYY